VSALAAVPFEDRAEDLPVIGEVRRQLGVVLGLVGKELSILRAAGFELRKLCACILAFVLVSAVKQSLELSGSGGGGRSALRKCVVQGPDYRFRGNDRRFVREGIPNGITAAGGRKCMPPLS
jgi:hypothetical protein